MLPTPYAGGTGFYSHGHLSILLSDVPFWLKKKKKDKIDPLFTLNPFSKIIKNMMLPITKIGF